MSGGQLVVLDPSGAAVKMYELGRGLATLGSRAPADIRIMLPEVCPHHATIAVHNSQTVIRNVGEGETLVNGQSVTVAALKHNDLITIGDRSLRWEYSALNKRHQVSLGLRKLPAVRGGARAASGARRASAGAPLPPRDRALQLAIEMSHRASMPASSGGKQVAIVQPQRRDHIEHNVPQNTTQATLWIESRKSSPRRRTVSPAVAPLSAGPARRALTPAGGGGGGRRALTPAGGGGGGRRALTPAAAPAARRALSARRRSTPLRLTVLRRAQSATKMKVVKIEAPSKIDHTKQAAIMLMTRHTPRARLERALPREATPSYVVKKPSPVRKTPGRKGRPSARGAASSGGGGDGITPKRRSVYQETRRSSRRGSGNNSVTILEITDSDIQSAASSSRVSSALPTPMKSSLKDFSKKSARKTESIKFDLSNLQNHQNDTTRCESEESINDDDLTLHYSESSSNSSARSPSPRRPIHSRTSRVLEQVGVSLAPSPSRTLTPASPRSKTSARGSLMLQRVLDGTDTDYTSTDRSGNTTVASAFRTRTLSPRKNMESFSIVDLVSINSDTSQNRTKSVYNSVDSVNTTDFETPNASNRNSRSTINPSLLGCSTPYASTRSTRPTRSTSIPELGQRSTRSSASSRRSKSLSTPENRPVSAVGAAPAARGTRSRSRINDTDLLLLDDTEMDDSPKSSRRSRPKDATTDHVVSETGKCTPENRLSPVDAGTPVLSIQSFLDSSRSSNRSSARKDNKSRSTRRKTVGVPSAVKRRSTAKSKSLGATARRSILRYSFESENQPQDAEENVTPRASVRLEQEAVKNQHSTAKKPQSRRSIIDDLDRSDIVKQLFNSPVKRKLSRSMTEFERRYDDEDDDVVVGRPARHTLATTGRSGDDSLSDISETFTPDRFVSPIGTPSHSPDLSGIKRLFQRSTPENDPRDVRGARSSLRTRRARNSIKHDDRNVTGVKLSFANSPRNRLSDVHVKEVFRRSPDNDLRRVTGVKSLFGKESSPKNDLTDVRGVKELFRRSPTNDLRNVSGVKRTLRNSPRNDLTDVRGVGRMFRHGTRKRSQHDVSGVEELFNESESRSQSSEELFDRLVGKPTVRKVYSRTFCTLRSASPGPERRKGTFHISLERIPAEVLPRQLKVRRRTREPLNVTKEMQKLATSTVEGEFPFLASRTRNSSLKKSASELYGAHTLPIKKRSLASPRAAPAAPAPRLPLKKRAVLHSTPMKGRLDVTMNASELGRVSPIRALDNTHTHETFVSRTTRQKTIPEAAQAHATGGPPKSKTPQKSAKRSPKASTSRASPPASPKANAAVRPKASPNKVHTPPKRATRNRKNTTVNTSKKGRASLVISKKAPVMSPKAGARTSPPPRRAATRKQDQKPSTPAKRTRLAKSRAAVVVPKPSPKLKPEASQPEDKPKRTRRNVAVHFESPKESQTKTRGKKNDSKGKENKSDNVSAEKPKRGRKPAAVEGPPATRRGRGADTTQNVKTRSKPVTKVDKPEVKQPAGRGKQTGAADQLTARRGKQAGAADQPTARRGKQAGAADQPTARRGKQAGAADQPTARRGKQAGAADQPTARRGRTRAENVSVEPQPKSRRNKTEPPLENVPKTRGKKIEIESSAQPEPVARGRRPKADKDKAVIPVPSIVENRRKRKTVPEEVVPAKLARTVTRRARKEPDPVPATTDDKKSAAKPRPTKDKEVTQPRNKTRDKKVEVEEPAPAKAIRGRKVAEPKESPELAEKRKRKSKVEASPVKGKKPSPGAAKKARQAEPAAAGGRTRAQAAEGGASGRNRRRR